MALTADQSALLQTTCDNLNQSVEINKEILELLKSTGNTGVVDIATHNADTSAHPSFANLFATLRITCSPDTAGADASGSPGGSRIQYSRNTSQEQLVNRFNMWGGWGNGGAVGAVNLLNGYGKNYDNSETFDGKTVISINAYGWVQNDGENEYKLFSSIGLGKDQPGRGFVTIGLNDQNYSNAQNLRIEYDRIVAIRSADVGSSTYQFKDCYLQNSPIVSSDRRLKQNFESVPEAVFKAWASVNFQVYKFKEAVEKKGEATARKHVGLVAQDIIEAFEAQGLNAFDYGIVCHDEWEDQYVDEQVIDSEAVYDKDGKLVTPEKSHTEKRFVKAAGDVYTVRYEEALALEAAYQRWKLGKIEQALAAKGITL